MTDSTYENTPHEPDMLCYRAHCDHHHVDEYCKKKSYLCCGECNHLFRTARALRKAYRQTYWDEYRRGYVSWRHLFKVDVMSMEIPLCYWIKCILFVRAKKIYTCPFCAHDF